MVKPLDNMENQNFINNDSYSNTQSSTYLIYLCPSSYIYNLSYEHISTHLAGYYHIQKNKRLSPFNMTYA